MIDLQEKLNRLPFRNEILDRVQSMRSQGIDSTELSRQLKKLGWSEKIPYAAGATRAPKKVPKPAPLTIKNKKEAYFFRGKAKD